MHRIAVTTLKLRYTIVVRTYSTLTFEERKTDFFESVSKDSTSI